MKAKSETYRILLVFALIALLAGCRGYSHLMVWSDETVDFSKHHSFAWLPDSTSKENMPYNNEIIRNNIRNFIGKEFVERGYFIDLDTPDVLLQVTLTSTRKYFYVVSRPAPYYYCRYYYGSIYCTPYPVEYYYRGQYRYPFIVEQKRVDYIQSAIILNVIERKKNSVIWTASAKADVFDPAYINEDIHPAIEAIMRKYPVKPFKKRYKKTQQKPDDVYSSAATN